MRLQKLTLENFRNYGKLELDFGASGSAGAGGAHGGGTTYIVGQNAQGKTNILEAIYLLALTRSFRTSAQEDLVLWDKDFCRVRGEFESGTTKGTAAKTELEVFYGLPPHPKKSLKKNGVRISAENFIGTCKAVFFHPEDLNMLYLGPDLRRRYLDVLNLQVNKNYYRALRNYKRVLKQRNALLKEIKEGFAKKADLEVWNEQLVENGGILISERARTVIFLNEFLEDFYRQIAESKDKILISYKCLLSRESGSARDGATGSRSAKIPEATDLCDLDAAKKIFRAALNAAEKIDLKAEITTQGPHRDDLEFLLNGRPLQSSASRGEYRSLLLALKLLELKFFEDDTSSGATDKPLLLLDDVFSELDLHRQKMLLTAIAGHQTIITTTHLDDIMPARKHGGLGMQGGLGQKLEVSAGKILNIA